MKSVVLVGARPDSAKYVSMKKKAAKEVGIESFEVVLGEDADEDVLVQHVTELNSNPDVDGILVQPTLWMTICCWRFVNCPVARAEKIPADAPLFAHCESQRNCNKV